MDLQSYALNPVYMAPSSWWQHVPIAHWLVCELRPNNVVELGSHYGVSFFSFCEAAQAFSPETFVYAVDTWEGDEHAGHYGDEVFNKVQQHWASIHRQRSRLIRSTFDEALEYFEDNSIDILHLDGLHTYEAVKHDFLSWRPKMKANSIVLFHDINVRERNFGVWKLWEELKEETQTYQVANGHGLGILVQGENLAAKLQILPSLLPSLVAKGVLLEKIAELIPEGSFNSIDQIRQELVNVSADADQAREAAIQARAEADQARAEADQARAEADQARAEADQARAEADQARTEADNMSLNFRKIKESRTWRLTGIVRTILDRIKRLT